MHAEIAPGIASGVSLRIAPGVASEITLGVTPRLALGVLPENASEVLSLIAPGVPSGNSSIALLECL